MKLPPEAFNDPFRPPETSIIVRCLHCGEEFDSYRMEWRDDDSPDGVRVPGRPRGFWCCPTEGCNGIGFGFDVFPTDPEYRDENGERMMIWDDDEGDDAERPLDELSDDGDDPEIEPRHGRYDDEDEDGGDNGPGDAPDEGYRM